VNYQDLLTKDRRLVVLRLLAADKGFSHNESILRKLLAQWGHTISRDQVRTLISWLAEQGFVDVQDIGGYLVAKLTGRGADIASGAATHPGVEVPGPGA